MIGVIYTIDEKNTLEEVERVLKENKIGNVYAYKSSRFTIIHAKRAKNINTNCIVDWEYVNKVFFENGFSTIQSI